MAAIKSVIAARDGVMHGLAKRDNWASQNPGVIVVFCIVFVVGSGLIATWIYKQLAKRKAAKSQI